MTRLCPACGDRAKVWRSDVRAHVDKVCAGLRPAKFDAACDEWRRITGGA